MNNKPEVSEQYYRATDVTDVIMWESKLAIRNNNVAALSGAVLMNCVYMVVNYITGSQSPVPIVSLAVLVVAIIVATVARNMHEKTKRPLMPVSLKGEISAITVHTPK